MGHLRVSRRVQLILLIGIIIGAAVESVSYNPSGWRPSGPSFSLQESKSHFSGYHNTISSSYESPYSDVTPATTIAPSITNIKMKTTFTTPRSREPTTPSNIDDEDAQINPALAIANSFAFNRPVYIYTGFPFHPDFTYVQ
ncbi:uncharacterized protein [Chelonus insularis]|uniref:uncharacterized protein n=1 Tax=Chelonus insularis TaxID=460826 RepID=UPI00158E62CA|nr:uncharacterized protein LOC118064705 [Chelonus insularis]